MSSRQKIEALLDPSVQGRESRAMKKQLTQKNQRRNSDMAATEQEILEGLGKIINEITGIPASDVTPEKNFVDDLDIDSLSMVEIAVAAQDEFGVEIPDDQLKNLKTVKDVLTFIQN
jgi:acyl carrier protein